MRRFYAPPDNFTDSNISLSNEETRHLRDVLRLREGDKVQVFDGEGKEFLCEIETIEKKDSCLKIIQEILPSAPESKLDLTLAVALLKGEKFDLVIQKAVELGVTKLFPLITKRTDVKLKETEKKIERWRKIILEASKQCGRAKLMRMEEPLDFKDFLRESASLLLYGENLVLFSERGGEGFSAVKSSKKITALIGSEGGWDDSEIELARENGIQIITLDGRILRAETAGIVIPALLQNHFGDLR
ncbi:MAG: 16S rRNA (uracil(1498)-N(3))-methyltransferase [Blastocatellia bacterium]|nr:16S rRNA (uracil(1498)-N(3))-methyltransferase [Blastocatellia bacterium]